MFNNEEEQQLRLIIEDVIERKLIGFAESLEQKIGDLLARTLGDIPARVIVNAPAPVRQGLTAQRRRELKSSKNSQIMKFF